MLIKRPDDILSSSITPESVYLNRREFVGAAGALAMAGFALPSALSAMSVNRQDLKPTSEDDITSYNNYYEFGTSKTDPKENAKGFKTSPWTVRVEGLVKTPKLWDLDDWLKGLAVEDRIYRHRCVEAWSMVVPWRGVSMKSLVNKLEPLPGAKFMEFTTMVDRKQMVGTRGSALPWPYIEAYRMDEVQNPLALMVTGLYGKAMPPQNGAPLRTIMPWKYGFKGCKAIVKIRFTDKQPRTTWNDVAPAEYGFYGNVNPAVDHPRWSQAKERVIGAGLFNSKIATLPFNGYSEQVASLYAGMDLRKNY